MRAGSPQSPRLRIIFLKNSAGIGWLEGKAEEGSWFAQGALFAQTCQRRIARFGGIESGASSLDGVTSTVAP